MSEPIRVEISPIEVRVGAAGEAVGRAAAQVDRLGDSLGKTTRQAQTFRNEIQMQRGRLAEWSRLLSSARGHFLGVFFSSLFLQMQLQRLRDTQERLNEAIERYGEGSEQVRRLQRRLQDDQRILAIQYTQVGATLLMLAADASIYIKQLALMEAMTKKVTIATAIMHALRGRAGIAALAIGGGLAALLMTQIQPPPSAQVRVGTAKIVEKPGLARLHEKEIIMMPEAARGGEVTLNIEELNVRSYIGDSPDAAARDLARRIFLYSRVLR